MDLEIWRYVYLYFEFSSGFTMEAGSLGKHLWYILFQLHYLINRSESRFFLQVHINYIASLLVSYAECLSACLHID